MHYRLFKGTCTHALLTRPLEETYSKTCIQEDKKINRFCLSPASHPRRDFDGGDVCNWINILHSGIVHVSVGELHTDAPLVGHNVRIGHDEAVTADNETRAIWHRDFPSWKWVPVKQQVQIIFNLEAKMYLSPSTQKLRICVTEAFEPLKVMKNHCLSFAATQCKTVIS